MLSYQILLSFSILSYPPLLSFSILCYAMLSHPILLSFSILFSLMSNFHFSMWFLPQSLFLSLSHTQSLSLSLSSQSNFSALFFTDIAYVHISAPFFFFSNSFGICGSSSDRWILRQTVNLNFSLRECSWEILFEMKVKIIVMMIVIMLMVIENRDMNKIGIHIKNVPQESMDDIHCLCNSSESQLEY